MIEQIPEGGYVSDTIDANIGEINGKTPFIVAVENGHIGVVRTLLHFEKAGLDGKKS